MLLDTSSLFQPSSDMSKNAYTAAAISSVLSITLSTRFVTIRHWFYLLAERSCFIPATGSTWVPARLVALPVAREKALAIEAVVGERVGELTAQMARSAV